MGGSTYVHYIMCISVNLIDMLISMVIIWNSPLFQHIQGDLKQICLYSGYEYLMASGGGVLRAERLPVDLDFIY